MLRAGSLWLMLMLMLALAACGSGSGKTATTESGSGGEAKAKAGGSSGTVTSESARSGSGTGSETESESGTGTGTGSGSATATATPTVAPAPPIVDLPLAWSDERAALTLDYRQRHESPDATSLDISPRVIVLHYTGGGSAKNTKRYFDRLTMEASREQLASAGKVNVSSHYLIDRDGTIYRLQPETRFARHCIGLNHVAIGVENVGDEQKWKLTEAQVKANVALVRELARRFPITHLLGHYEVMKFRGHPYFVERDASYRNSKPDPGARFMAAVRAELAEQDELSLAGLDEEAARAP